MEIPVYLFTGFLESGKTTFALKLAHSLNNKGKKKVLYVSFDLTIPALSYLFPNCKESELYSIGKVLDNTDIYREDVLRSIVTTKNMPELGYLGFKTKENKYTYPRPTEDKISQLFFYLRAIADYVVIDCDSDRSSVMSTLAKREADTVIQVVTPNLKSVSYFVSNGDQFENMDDKTVKVINIKDNDIFLPIEEVKELFKKVEAVVPYSKALKQQAITGSLSETLNDKMYTDILAMISKVVE